MYRDLYFVCEWPGFMYLNKLQPPATLVLDEIIVNQEAFIIYLVMTYGHWKKN